MRDTTLLYMIVGAGLLFAGLFTFKDAVGNDLIILSGITVGLLFSVMLGFQKKVSK